MRTVVAVVAFTTACSACSLLVSSNGYVADENGDAAVDADADASTSVPNDAATDALGDADAATHGHAFVAVGDQGRRIVSFDDGLTWTREALDPAPGTRLDGVAFGAGRFIAVGTSYGPEFRSVRTDDLTNWFETKYTTVKGAGTIAWGNGRFFAGGGGTPVGTSVDGVDWQFTSAPLGVDQFSGLGFGDGKVMAVGEDGSGAVAATSTDGLTWNAVKVGGSRLTCVAYGNGRWVVGGRDGRKGTSTNGVDWNFAPVTNASEVAADIAFGKGIFVTNLGFTSPDGLAWTTQTLDAIAITYGNGFFVAVTDTGKITRSVDGLSWSAPIESGIGLFDITYGEW